MLTARSAAVAVLVAATGCGGGGGPTGGSTTPTPGGATAVVVLDAASFESRVLASPRPSLVEFWSPTCPACQTMVSIVERLAADFDGRALVGTVDATRQPALTTAQQVSLVPTFVFYKGGGEVSRQVGATSYEDLAARLQALVAAP
jgi:thioredoxin 1